MFNEKPIVVEFEEDYDSLVDLAANLSDLGYLEPLRFRALYDMDELLDEFYEHHHTYPNYLLLTTPECDERADGPTARLMDETHLDRWKNRESDYITYSVERALKRTSSMLR